MSLSLPSAAPAPPIPAPVPAAPPPALLANKRELCQVLGITPPTLTAWLEKWPGFPVHTEGTLGREWQFDPAAVRAFLDAKAAEEKEAERARVARLRQLALPVDVLADPTGENLGLTPQARQAMARARQLEQRTLLEAGQLVPTSEARVAFATAAGLVARFLDSLVAHVVRQHRLSATEAAQLREFVAAGKDQFRRALAEFRPGEGPARVGDLLERLDLAAAE